MRRWFAGPRPEGPEDVSSWDARFRVLDLTGAGDWLTLGDLFTGVGVFGAAGSGKTSSLAAVAHALMTMDCGFVWLCAKPDEVRLAVRIAEAAGRGEDVIVVGQDVDGRITPERFNPLAYEVEAMARTGADGEGPEATTGTGSVVRYLSDCAKVLSRKEGESAAGEGDRFWIDQFERLLRHCVDTARLAGLPLSVGLLRRIQLSAPRSDRDLGDNQWARSSECWQCLNEAERRRRAGEVADADVARVMQYWTQDYLTLDNRPRSSIDVSFAVLVDAFYAEEPLRSILTTTTTVTPEDVIERGKIVVLSLPTNVFHAAGRMAQFCFKHSFQRAMLRRRADASEMQRPCVLWVDEAHAFAHAFDAQYFAEVRSNRGINVFMDQGVGGYMRALGYNHASQVDGFLQNLATKFFFQNNSPETNHFAAEAIGKLLTEVRTSTVNPQQDFAQVGIGYAQRERHQVASGEFGLLRRGGPENGGIVEGFVLKPSAFRKTGANVARCAFRQTDLTK